MENSKNTLINNSILYRCAQKYFDRQLSEFQIGSGQIMYLILVYENEGITMQNLAKIGNFDKGTVTKGVQKLIEAGYLREEQDASDHRIKCLYSSESAKTIMAVVYLMRQEWWSKITSGMSKEEANQFEYLQHVAVNNALKESIDDDSAIRFFGLQKLTLLDYPGKMAATVFTGGCNFKCPFCQNADLVFLPENTVEIPKAEITQFLSKRHGILEGVCISGGEPLLHVGLADYLKQLKRLGYAVKLDTNGSMPDKLKDLVDSGLVDYVAMDIKNSPQRYGETIGIADFDLQPIKESVEYLLSGHIPYEFRTTIVAEYHDEAAIKAIGEWIKRADAYYLQNFVDSERVIKKGLHALDEATLKHYQDILVKTIPNTHLRGI